MTQSTQDKIDALTAQLKVTLNKEIARCKEAVAALPLVWEWEAVWHDDFYVTISRNTPQAYVDAVNELGGTLDHFGAEAHQSMKHLCLGGYLIATRCGYIVTRAAQDNSLTAVPWAITPEEVTELRAGHVPDRIKRVD